MSHNYNDQIIQVYGDFPSFYEINLLIYDNLEGSWDWHYLYTVCEIHYVSYILWSPHIVCHGCFLDKDTVITQISASVARGISAKSYKALFSYF